MASGSKSLEVESSDKTWMEDQLAIINDADSRSCIGIETNASLMIVNNAPAELVRFNTV